MCMVRLMQRKRLSTLTRRVVVLVPIVLATLFLVANCDDFIFFFFQAEDGIRDLTVTGVQTCALPIWSSAARSEVVVPDKADDMKLLERIAAGDADALGELYDRYGRVAFGVLYRMLPGRSGERRVGEEGRSRWAPDPLKKK